MNFKEALIAHPYAQVLRWIADGEKIQRLTLDEDGKSIFKDISNDAVLIFIASGRSYDIVTRQDIVFRLHPRTITVNGVEVPAPESVAPKQGVYFFVPDFEMDGMFMKDIWSETNTDNKFLERGIVYLNKEDAIARAKAMLLHE